MEKSISNHIVIVTGRPGMGKTFFSVMWGCTYPRVIANLSIFDKFKKKINQEISSIDDIEKLEYNSTKGVLILDEGAINASSRQAMTKNNRSYTELAVLSRKKNLDIIFIVQHIDMLDLNLRRIAVCEIALSSYYDEDKKTMLFDTEVTVMGDDLPRTKRTWDLIRWASISGVSYDTLETSIIQKTA